MLGTLWPLFCLAAVLADAHQAPDSKKGALTGDWRCIAEHDIAPIPEIGPCSKHLRFTKEHEAILSYTDAQEKFERHYRLSSDLQFLISDDPVYADGAFEIMINKEGELILIQERWHWVGHFVHDPQ